MIRKLAPHSAIILVVLGLTLISTAAGMAFSLPAGLAVAGVSCFVLEWRLHG